MPAYKRQKTKYQDVFYIQAKAGKKFYIRYYHSETGKRIEEPIGLAPGVTAARVNQVRLRRIFGERSNRERRSEKEESEDNEKEKYSINRIWEIYLEQKHYHRSRDREVRTYNKHLRHDLGMKEPSLLVPLDVDRLRIRLQKAGKYRTAVYVIGFIKRIARFGEEKGLCDSLKFKIAVPKYKSEKTEVLTEAEMQALLASVELDHDPQARGIVLTALYTGMRRSAIFRLRWDDLNFDRELIFLRQPKGGNEGETHVIPMNSAVRNVLENHPRTDSPYVFPGINGDERVGFKRSWERIKKRACMPKRFRFHDLRHTFGTIAAVNGVDLFTLKSIMTHSQIQTTERYIHISKEWASKASETVAQAMKKTRNMNFKKKTG